MCELGMVVMWYSDRLVLRINKYDAYDTKDTIYSALCLLSQPTTAKQTNFIYLAFPYHMKYASTFVVYVIKNTKQTSKFKTE
jgi:hypothetical protein